MTKVLDKYEVGIEPAGAFSLNGALEFRLQKDEAVEQERAALSHDARSLVSWPIDPIQAVNFYYSNPWLMAIGNLLADAVSAAEWTLESREADTDGNKVSRKEARADKAYDAAMTWLSREDVGMDGITKLDLPGLLRSLCLTYDIHGTVFAEIVRNKGNTEPARIAKLMPQYIMLEYKDGLYQLYQQAPHANPEHLIPFGTRKSRDDRHEYVMERLANDFNSFYGIPPWIASRDSVEVDNNHRAFLKGFFKNHSTPRYMITVRVDPAWLAAGNVEPEKKQLDTLKTAIVNFLSANQGSMSGRNLVINAGGGILVEATPLDNKVDDPTFPNTAKAMRDEILAVRHVSLLNLGFGESSNRATSDNQSENFRKEVLEPFAAPAVSIINRVLHAAAPSGLNLENWDFKLNFVRVSELLEKFEALSTATGAPILTRDEGRHMVGFEPMGANALLEPVNMAERLQDDTLEG